MKVEFTKTIPLCPYCKEPTIREMGIAIGSLVIKAEVYDENGDIIKPTRSNMTYEWICKKCGKHYLIHGNSYDGYKYVD